MIKLKKLILLEQHDDTSYITIEDIENKLSHYMDRDSKFVLETLSDFYYSNDIEKKEEAVNYIKLLNKVFHHIIALVSKLNIPHININIIKQFLLEQSDFRSKLDEFFPFPIYIAATKNKDGDWAEVGILIDENGKVLEIHEGNDESTSETDQLANRLVHPHGKKVRIYGSHNTKLVQQIETTGYLPKNLFISPYKPHALAYLDIEGERSAFTGIIDSNDVAHVSHIDWKTLFPTKIENFKWL